MKPLTNSGQARIAHDTAKRFRGIAEVLVYDVRHRTDLTPTQVDEVAKRVQRYVARAEEIEAEVEKYRGAWS